MRASKAFASSQRVDAVADPNVEYAVEEAQTLWVVYNHSTGKRGRTFVSVVDESQAEPMPDAKTFANHMHLGENDRSCHELEVRIQVLQDAACHDR